MSWQAEYEKKYREQLEREWTVEGKRKIQLKGRSKQMYDTLTAQIRQAQKPSMTQSSYSAVPRGIPVVYGHSEHGITLDIMAKNTREICGND